MGSHKKIFLKSSEDFPKNSRIFILDIFKKSSEDLKIFNEFSEKTFVIFCVEGNHIFCEDLRKVLLRFLGDMYVDPGITLKN